MIEGTFAWFDNDRRLCQYYETSFDAAQDVVEIAAIKLSLNIILTGSIYAELGFDITNFRVEGTTFSEETLNRINKIGNMISEAMSASEVDMSYKNLEKLKALRDAARNEGGLEGVGLQMGARLEIAKSIFSAKKENTANIASQTEVSTDPVEQLRKIKLLLSESLITQEEFDQKKKEILSKI